MKIKHPHALMLYDLLHNLLSDIDALSGAVLDGLSDHAPEADRKMGELVVRELRMIAAPYRAAIEGEGVN